MKKLHVLIFCVILLIGAALRLYKLGTIPISMYIDGTLQSQQPSMVGIGSLDNTVVFYIGRVASQYFQGDLDEIRVSNSARY